jgi:hypothetical protein
MKFSAQEELYLQKTLDSTVTLDNVHEYLPQNVYDFLKSRNNLNTILDKLIISKSNFYRPYESFQVTKFILPDFKIDKFLENLIDLEGDLTVFIDCHFMIVCPSPEDITEPIFKFERGSKASSFNDILKIRTDLNFKNFVSEFKNCEKEDLMNRAFQTHVDFFKYHSSGLRPYSLLSLLIHVKRN